MRIAMFGVGYVGLVTGTCLAELGNDVVCVDVDAQRIAMLQGGIMPIYEPGLKDLVARNTREERLSFTTDGPGAIETAQVIFNAVGTPPLADGSADLSAVDAVARLLGEHLKDYAVVVNKSTVPVGTGDRVRKIIATGYSGEFDVVSNPEFLREGAAIKDFMVPDRIVVGADSPRAGDVMRRLYRTLERTDRPLLLTDVRTAELIKYASNAFLATKISFINEMALLCERVGADVKMVARGMGLDSRIGPRFLQAGIGFGGSCFPKDILALVRTAKENLVDLKILREVLTINDHMKLILLPRLEEALGELDGRKVAIWGLAFKPKTDDIRDATSLELIRMLLRRGATVAAFDPEAMDKARQVLPDVTYGRTPYDVVADADALLLVTEWDEFRNVDFDRVRSAMRRPLLFDGRNIYHRQELEASGFEYHCIGRVRP